MTTFGVMGTAGGRKDGISEPVFEGDEDSLNFSGGVVRVGNQTDMDGEESPSEKSEVDPLQVEVIALKTQIRALRASIHDANNQLVPLLGYLDLALIDVTNDKTRRDLSIVADCARKVAVLLQRAMSSNSELRLNREPLDLNGLISAVLISAKQFLDAGITVDFPNENHIKIFADRINLHSVLLNLVKNAAEALENTSNATISLNFFEEGKFVKLLVSDNGPGIPANLREAVFADGGVSTKGDKGHGLGLPMVKKIVEAHGGKISLESTTADEGKNTGTSFCITLPSSI